MNKIWALVFSIFIIGHLGSIDADEQSESASKSNVDGKAVSAVTDDSQTSKGEASAKAPKTAEEEEPPSPEPRHSFNIVLPTKNEHIFDQPEKFYMHTNRHVNGVNVRPWRGGTYGFVRNQRWIGYHMYYTRLHEGVDIRPIDRDSHYVPLDEVFAISDGTVVYSKSNPSGGYGRYMVVKHNWPEGSFYSLYGHLAKCIAPVDSEVKAGETLGILGYSGHGVDRERAHLHVELNFLMSEKYHVHWSPGDPSNNYSGLNMTGLNIGRLFLESRKDPDLTIQKFLAEEEPYFKVKSINPKKPGLLDRHPWLGQNMDQAASAKGWQWTFTREGVPLAIEPFDTYQKYTNVSWVKPDKYDHSYMTSWRLTGVGDRAYLTSKGHSFVALFSETFH